MFALTWGDFSLSCKQSKKKKKEKLEWKQIWCINCDAADIQPGVGDGFDFCLSPGAELLPADGGWPARIITTWPTDSNSLKSSLQFFRWVCLPLLSSCSHVAPSYDATTLPPHRTPPPSRPHSLTGCNYSSTEVTTTANSLLQLETCFGLGLQWKSSIWMLLSVHHFYFFFFFFTMTEQLQHHKPLSHMSCIRRPIRVK